MEETSSWKTTDEEEQNAKHARVRMGVNRVMHQSNAIALAASAAFGVVKGIVTKIVECKSCGHKIRKW